MRFRKPKHRPRKDDLVKYLMRYAGYAKFENDDFDNKSFGEIADEIVVMVMRESIIGETYEGKLWHANQEINRLQRAVDEHERRWEEDARPAFHKVEDLKERNLRLIEEKEDLEQRMEVADTAIVLNGDLASEVEKLTIQKADLAAEVNHLNRSNAGLLKERNTWARQLADAKDAALNAEEEVDKQRSNSADVLRDRDELTVAIGELIERNDAAGFDAVPIGALKRIVRAWEAAPGDANE